MKVRRLILLGLMLCVLVGFPLFAQTDDRRLYQDAESRFRVRDYELALDRYSDLVSEYPLSSHVPDAQFRSAVCLFRLDSQEEALDLFRKVESRYGSTQFIAYVPFWIGVIEYNRRNYAEAAINLSRFIEVGDATLSNQALLYLAISEQNLGNTTVAIEYLESLTENLENPTAEPYAIVLLASLYVRQGEYNEVISLTNSLESDGIASDIGDRLRLYRAEAYWHLGNADRAVELYLQLLEAPPEIASVAYQRLFLHYQRIEDEEELQNIVLAAEIKLAGLTEILGEFWLRIGIETYRQGKRDLALSYFQRIWNMKPLAEMDGLVPLYLADILYSTGQRSQAIERLEGFMAVSIDQREFIVLRLAGYHMDQGRWGRSIELYGDLLEEFPESIYYSEAAYLQSYGYYKSEQYREAISRINSVLGEARGGGYTEELLRLKSVLYKQIGDSEAAIQALREYLPLVPQDAKARMDLIKLHFQQREYTTVISEVEKIKEETPFNDSSSVYFLLSRYLYGLSHISGQDYTSAHLALAEIELNSVLDADLGVIYPYTLYYRGWASYRSGEYEAAETDFVALLDGAEGHELFPRAAYLAGWCAFAISEFDRAAEHLSRIPLQSDMDLVLRGRFMYAKSLLGQGKVDEAAIAFESIYLDAPVVPIADDALFEYAGTLAELEKIDESVDTYQKVFDEYRGSALAEEAMYKRGELLYDEGELVEAGEAFYEYRLQFPRGGLFDAALYWGGMAAADSDEPFRAILLWEKLIDEFVESSFRADALRRTAEVYEETGDFRKALSFYGELTAIYPDEARAIKAEDRAEKLRFLILGQGEEEAVLSVIIGREGNDSKEGRDAMIELARIYIYKSGSKQNLAPSILEDVITKQDGDTESAAKAQYLMGEYFYRKNDLRQAAAEFLEVVLLDPPDRDLIAQALYRAAEMTYLAGSEREAEALVDRIEETFPSSQWVEEGRKLLRGEQ